MPTLADEYSRRRLMAALAAIIDGKTISARIAVFDQFGRDTTIFGTLNYAARHLTDCFDSIDLEIADRACLQLGIPPTTDRRNLIAKALLKALLAQGCR